MIITLILICILILIFFKSTKSYFNKIDYDTKIISEKLLKNSLKEYQTKLFTFNELFELAKLYHYGTLDKYDSNGKLINGIDPQPNLAIPIYINLLKHDLNNILIIDNLCELYHYSIPGFEYLIDYNKAKYYYFIKYSINKDPNILQTLQDLAFYTNDHTLFYELKNKKKQNTINNNNTNNNDINNDINNTQFVNRTNVLELNNDNHDNEIFTDELVIKNDKHNVHDTTLINTMKHSLDKLKKETNIQYTPQQTFDSIKQDIDTMIDISKDRRQRAYQGLDAIKNINANISVVNMNELDILNLVYHRINSDDNKDNKQVLKENLVHELSESIEHNRNVCDTGRFTRVIDSLNGVDPMIQIKPKWALSQEMIEKAGQIYKIKYDSLDNSKKQAIDSLDMNIEQNEIYNTLKNEIKNEIKDSFTNDYVKSGILTEDSLNYEMDKWIDNIL